jgi:hypothetical protein
VYDRAAEGAGLRALGVDVNPLVVAGDVGECVDSVLLDSYPLAAPQVAAGPFPQSVRAADD